MRLARWRQLAYLARYARQPLSELRALTLSEINLFAEAIAEIVREENKPTKQ